MKLKRLIFSLFFLHYLFLTIFLLLFLFFLQLSNERNSIFDSNAFILTAFESILIDGSGGAEEGPAYLQSKFEKSIVNFIKKNEDVAIYTVGIMDNDFRIIACNDKKLINNIINVNSNDRGTTRVAGENYLFNIRLISNSGLRIFILENKNHFVKVFKLHFRWFLIIIVICFFINSIYSAFCAVKISFPVEDIRNKLSVPLPYPAGTYIYEEANHLCRSIQAYKKDVNEKILNLQDELNTDTLTALGNRRAFKRLMKLMAPEIFSVIAIDIDNFKVINDTYGHAAGDSVLKEFSQIIRDSCGDFDYAFRFGGEEFIIFCNNSTKEDARALAQKIIVGTRNRRFIIQDKVTISAGVFTAFYGESPVIALKYADDALYKAKAQGKNRVCSYS